MKVHCTYSYVWTCKMSTHTWRYTFSRGRSTDVSIGLRTTYGLHVLVQVCVRDMHAHTYVQCPYEDKCTYQYEYTYTVLVHVLVHVNVQVDVHALRHGCTYTCMSTYTYDCKST